jgi:hypothetical protein
MWDEHLDAHALHHSPDVRRSWSFGRPVAVNYLIAIGIQLLAFAVTLYRYRGQGLSPDGHYYRAMQAGHRVPPPYSRRWLLPLLFKKWDAWRYVSGLAFVAAGPLVYAMMGSLAAVWLMAWLPGLLINVRLPVLVDQLAFTLMLLAGALFVHDHVVLAAIAIFVSGQVKESAPIFGAALCWHPITLGACIASFVVAVFVGAARGAEKDQDFMLSPFRVAMTKHDPLDFMSMVLPWGSIAVLLACTSSQIGPTQAWVAAGLSVLAGYGQLIIANDENRLFHWAAPALLVALSLPSAPWVIPVLAVHPFLCGMVRRV